MGCWMTYTSTLNLWLLVSVKNKPRVRRTKTHRKPRPPQDYDYKPHKRKKKPAKEYLKPLKVGLKIRGRPRKNPQPQSVITETETKEIIPALLPLPEPDPVIPSDEEKTFPNSLRRSKRKSTPRKRFALFVPTTKKRKPPQKLKVEEVSKLSIIDKFNIILSILIKAYISISIREFFWELRYGFETSYFVLHVLQIYNLRPQNVLYFGTIHLMNYLHNY